MSSTGGLRLQLLQRRVAEQPCHDARESTPPNTVPAVEVAVAAGELCSARREWLRSRWEVSETSAGPWREPPLAEDVRHTFGTHCNVDIRSTQRDNRHPSPDRSTDSAHPGGGESARSSVVASKASDGETPDNDPHRWSSLTKTGSKPYDWTSIVCGTIGASGGNPQRVEWHVPESRRPVSAENDDLFGQAQLGKRSDRNGCATGEGELFEHGGDIRNRHAFVSVHRFTDGAILAPLQPIAADGKQPVGRVVRCAARSANRPCSWPVAIRLR